MGSAGTTPVAPRGAGTTPQSLGPGSPLKRAAAVIALLAALVGCDAADDVEPSNPSTSATAEDKPTATVEGTGFTQADGYATAVAALRADDRAAGGASC